MDRNELVSKILEGYQGFFDINKTEESDLGLAARCDFHIHNSKYVLVKNAKLWEADCNEYIYVFSVDKLTEELFEKCIDYVLTEGDKLINPRPGHMYTYLTAAFVCSDYDEEAAKRLKKIKRYKSYKFSLHGWSELRAYMVNAADKAVFTNKAGKSCVKFLKKIT